MWKQRKSVCVQYTVLKYTHTCTHISIKQMIAIAYVSVFNTRESSLPFVLECYSCKDFLLLLGTNKTCESSVSK